MDLGRRSMQPRLLTHQETTEMTVTVVIDTISTDHQKTRPRPLLRCHQLLSHLPLLLVQSVK